MKKLILTVLCMASLFMLPVLSGCNDSADAKTPVSNIEETGNWLIGEHFYYGQDCIWGNTLAGLEYEYAEGKKVGQYLTTFDLSSHEKKRVLRIPKDRIANTPSIYQNKIVWDSVDSEEFFEYAVKSSLPPPPNYDIFLLDLDNGKVTQLTTEEHAQRSPAIYGDTVVWLDARNQPQEQYPFPFDIYVYDLKIGQEKRITEKPTVEGYNQLAMDGSIIVWSDMRHADMEVASHAGNDSAYNNEIYAYDLNTGIERRLTTSPRNDQSPDISGNIVTWLRQEDYQKADILVHDLESGTEMQVSTSGYAAFSPSIYENRIVWTDARSSNGNTNNDVVINGQGPGADIYLYDLETGTETKLTATEEWKLWQSPVISSDHMIYQWNRQTGPLVYIMDLSPFTGANPTALENHILIPVKDMDLFQVEQEAPDDVMPAPGMGPNYRANIHQQGIENPWPSIVGSESIFYSVNGVAQTQVFYRKYIDTPAGETRNNIIKVVMPGEEVSSLSLYVDNIPQGITFTDGLQWSSPFARVSVLVIEIAPDITPGDYPLEIGLIINGKDFGTVTCKIRVINPAIEKSTVKNVYHSEEADLSVTLPEGWAAVEGPESLAHPFEGQVAFNSWGEEDFWARIVRTDYSDHYVYSPTTVMSQIPEGGAYVALVCIWGPPHPDDYNPLEYVTNDLSRLCQPHDWRQDSTSDAKYIPFYKWGRDLRLEIACRPDASNETVEELNNLLASWQFDSILTGDTGWLETQALQLLPKEVEPLKFSNWVGTSGDENISRAVELETNGDMMIFRFIYRWGSLVHWWTVEVSPIGETILTDEGGDPLTLN